MDKFTLTYYNFTTLQANTMYNTTLGYCVVLTNLPSLNSRNKIAYIPDYKLTYDTLRLIL